MALLSQLYEKPNHVPQRQQYYQNNPNPLFFRGPRQRLYIGTYSALFAGGMFVTLFACTQLVKGKKTE